MNYKKLLLSKNFSTLTDNATGTDYYSLVVPNEKKSAIKNIFCKQFSFIADEIADLEKTANNADYAITLESTSDFEICLFYYNDSYWYIETDDFMHCITQI